MIRAICLFTLAGLCEIGGGYLVWLAIREGRSAWLAVFGIVILGLYGVVPTLQATNFGRAYAAYGGVFVALSIFWGWRIDQIPPDKFDLLGGFIILLGVFVMMFAPRS
ncbi:MAG: YnfA family protein [Cyanobacteria bacterium P01_F01_bin.42]